MKVLKISTIVLILGTFVPILGCASNRYLSEEEDEKMRAMCEQPGGCAVVPGNLWRDIQRLIESMRGV